MIRDARFWFSIVLLPIVTGLVAFAVTRAYYRDDPATAAAQPSTVSQPPVIWPAGITEADIRDLGSTGRTQPAPTDPIEISLQADAYFANRQYDLAAERYTQLLAFDPNNVDVHNNLGLTLHYLGRSDEALRQLDEGVAVDPTYQRIWLTIGYVNSQLGNTEKARAALTTASEIGSDESIRQSAKTMLENLP